MKSKRFRPDEDLNRETADYHRLSFFPILGRDKKNREVFGKVPVELSVLAHSRKQAIARARGMVEGVRFIIPEDKVPAEALPQAA